MRISDWSSDVCSSDLPFPVVSPKAGGADNTMPAGTFPPNGYGLHDMTGNAWQWVSDWYRFDYFAMQAQAGQKPIDNPKGPGESFDPNEPGVPANARSEEHTSEHQSLMRNPYAVFC